MENFNTFVSNSSVTIFLGREFRKEEYCCIAKCGINSVYNPKKFHAIIVQFRTKKQKHTTALVFRTGRVVLTGARNMLECRQSFRKLTKMVNNALVLHGDFPKISTKRLCIRNVVLAGCLPSKIYIERIYSNFMENFVSSRKYLVKSCRYDPSIFPGIRIASKLQFTIILFISGNFIVTGLKDYEKWNLDKNLLEILKFLSSFERKSHFLE
jgi:TATA-box binding protein (TBP) (component of TFIID and TFIIIB)